MSSEKIPEEAVAEGASTIPSLGSVVGESLLIVDDQRESAEALESFLSVPGRRVVKASSGREALDRLSREDFAVILMDIQMPDMDGFDTAVLIRSRERSRHTPIIFMTGAYHGDARMFQGYSIGAVDYLYKPVHPDILRAKVSAFIALFRQGEVLRALNRKLTKEIEERLRAEETVLSLRQDLELRILERTAQLATANEDLQREVLEKKRAEEGLTASLREKETLLKEIHHRVKNNLQIVQSLINLQTRHIQDRQTLAGLKDCRDRVKVMALAHGKLYRSKDLARIDFSDYLRDLSESVLQSFGISGGLIRVTLDAEPVGMGVDEAIPCGLIVYELLSNCCKHAFPEGKRGKINISFKRDGKNIVMDVKDDGRGIPGENPFESPSSLGLQLVSSLTRQLAGSLQREEGPGTHIRVVFPVSHGEGFPLGVGPISDGGTKTS